MTQQFDEGVKEILMTLASLGATIYETDYVLKELEKRPESTQQLVQAVKIADEKIDDNRFDQVAQDVIAKLTEEEPKEEPKEEPTLVRGELNKPFYIFNRLVEGGLTPIAAIGVVANLKAESNLNSSTKQYGGGPGRGLAQWEKGGRYDTDRINLVKFAKKRGVDWSDMDAQIDFILHEMNVHPEYKRVKRDINKVGSVEEATLLFLKRYEKAGIPHTSKRLKYAKELASRLLS